MLLTVDVGNTHTVIGGFEGADLRFMWRIVTDKNMTEDEIRAKLVAMFAADNRTLSQVEGTALACVVPRLSAAWKRATADLFGTPAWLCTAESTTPLFRAAYPNPHEIGSDRVADAIAVVARYGAPAVVVDFGTATNIEVIDAQGQFVGGIIAPGVETSANALFSYCSKLSAIDLVAPPQVVGTSSEEAMQSGIVLGEAARIDGLVRRIFAQLGYEAPVVATGGLAALIAPYCDTVTQVDTQLTLEGLRLAFSAAENETSDAR